MLHDVEVTDDGVVVRCTPARSVTLLTGRTSGTAVNAGRLGYRYGAEILEVSPDDGIVAARLDLPGNAPFARRGGRRGGASRMDEPPVVVAGLTAGERRAASRESLGRTAFDLLVIGGGVIGAATAAHAARAGLAVALVEARDFGSGTSSASSKLVHGGLRYLRLGDVRLVREAHHERRTLAGSVAPHLVHRLPFLLPLYRGGPFRPAFVQSGILVYSTLARSRLNWLVNPARASALVPSLRLENLRSCALYADAWTNDARLCLENVVAAAEAGAVVLNGAEVVSLRTVGGRVNGAEVLVDGETVGVDARVTVNAAGPWVDGVRRLEDPRAGTSVRLSKGAHVLVPGGSGWTAALTIPQDDVRVTFAVPWCGLLLLGTTDSDYEGEPGAVEADETDIAQILDEAATALPGALLGRGRSAPRSPVSVSSRWERARRRTRGGRRSSRSGRAGC